MSASVNQKSSNAKALVAAKPQPAAKKEPRAQVPDGMDDALTLAEDQEPIQAEKDTESTGEAQQWQVAQLSATDSSAQVMTEDGAPLTAKEVAQAGSVSRASMPWVLLGSSVAIMGAMRSGGEISPQDQALNNIRDYAQRNTSDASNQPSGTVPTLDTYTTAGIKGVTKDNIRAINNILESAIVTGDSVSSKAKLQEIVDSYNSLLVLTDGNANNATAAQALTVKQIGNLGIDTTGLTSGSQTAQRMGLLNNLLDQQEPTDVDSVAKIKDLVSWVNQLSDFADGKPNAVAFKRSDFERMGVSDVTDANLNVLLDEVKKSGAGTIDSLSDITALIDKSNLRIEAAFKAIQDYAQANENPGQAARGTAPSVQNYQDVGVLRVDGNNKDIVNSALTTLGLNKDKLQTTADIQKVVDAYNAVLTLATGGPNSATAEQAITIANLNSLGLDTTGLNGANAAQRLSLLNNVLDAQVTTGVDTIAEVGDLVKLVNTLEDLSGGVASNPALTSADFQRMGVSGVTDANLNVLLDEVKKSGAGTIDSLSDITKLIDKSNLRIEAAFKAIQDYAQANENPNQAATGTAPSVQNYQDVGVLRVNGNNRDIVNSALTTLGLNKDKLQTTADIQKVVDAYNAVLTLATGGPNSATEAQAITIANLNSLGLDTTGLNGANAAQRLSLLNNVLDAQVTTGVDTIAEVSDLVKFVTAISDQAAGLVPSYAMQVADFAKLGIQGVDAQNLADILQSIAAQKNRTPLSSLAQINSLIAFYAIAPLAVSLTQDTGLNNTDAITSNAALTVGGTPQVDATLEYSVDGGVTYSSTYVLPTSNALQTVWVRQVSKEGYLGKSSQLSFTLDKAGPNAPTLDAGTLYFGQTDTQAGNAKIATPNAAVPATQDIAKIQLTLAGVDTMHDQWLLGELAINLNGTAQQNTNQSVAGVSVDWQYTVVDGNHTITLVKNGGGKLDDAQVASIEKAMAFKSVGGSQGQRILSIAHTDVAGNVGDSASRTLEIDLTSPVIQLAAGATGYATNARANATIALSNAGVITDTAPIKSLSVTAKNFQDNESLVINNVAINMYGANATGTISVTGANGAAWSWSYDSQTRQVVFTANGLNASAAQASALLQAMQYQNASTSQGHTGKRELIFKTTDAAGNESVAATTSLNYVATVAKVATTSALDVDANGVPGDQFVISFTELVKIADLQNPSNWTIKNAVSAPPTLGAVNIKAVDVQNMDGVDYAKHFWVKSGAGSANWVAGQQQTFSFGDAQTAGKQAYLTLPTKTFGGDLTLEAWLYMDATPGSFARIFDLGTTTFTTSGPNSTNGNQPQGSDNIIFGFNGENKLFFQIYNGQTTTNSTLISDTALTAKTWYHLAATIDNNKNATIYINGVVDKSVQFDFGANRLERDLNYINKSAWNGDGYLSGNIFDARVYDNARSIEEIKNDMKGMVDPGDSNQVYWYNLNGNLNSGLSNNTAAATGVNTVFNEQNPGTTFTISADKVVDTTGQTTAVQKATLYKSSNVNGSYTADNLVGTDGDDFITGQGGNDNLTGGAGRDVFAWLKGNTGTDTVTDFKLLEKDQIHLGSILQGTGVQSTNMDQFLEWTKVGNDMQLKIHLDGNINNSANQTIVFTNGANQGLDVTLASLVSQKAFVLDAVV